MEKSINLQTGNSDIQNVITKKKKKKKKQNLPTVTIFKQQKKHY
jgi:hypothetical protein